MDVFRLPTRKLGLVIVLAVLMFASMFLNMDTYRSSSSVPMSESPSCPPITTITKEIFKAAPPPKKVVAEDFSSEYRQRLNSIRPIDRLPHSKTLGVASRIYVIGLPGRKDRRDVMAKLEKAMDIEFTWHDATDMHGPLITRILERIRWARAEARKGHESEIKVHESFPWSLPEDATSTEPLRRGELAGAELWTLDDNDSRALAPLPPPPTPDTRPEEVGMYGDNDPAIGDTIKLPVVACWHSHYSVLRRIAEGDDDVAIILEDDIDVEWDLERKLRRMWEHLPSDWDQVMLGHCQSHEGSNLAVPQNPYLHPTQHVMCTHAYVVSKRSAAHLIRLLRNPVFAYSRPIDHAYMHIYGAGRSKMYSVYPQVVIQAKNTMSDISPGAGSPEDAELVDSALERIALLEEGGDI